MDAKIAAGNVHSKAEKRHSTFQMNESESPELPPEILAKIKDKCEKIDKVVKAIYYAFNEHGLTNYDCCVALSGAFNGIKSTQANDDSKTELEMMMRSLIEQRPELETTPEPSQN